MAAILDIRHWVLLAAVCGCSMVGAAALASGFGALELPYALTRLDVRLPGLFRLHMLAGGVGLVLLPLAFATRRLATRWHRAIGRAALVALAVGALSGIVSGVASFATPVARAGFVAQGLVTAALLLAAFRAVRHRRYASHARLMQAAAAVVSGVLLLRIGTWIVARYQLEFGASYAALAWGSWALPLAVALAWQWGSANLRLRDSRSISMSG